MSIMVRTLMSEVVVDQTDAMGKWFIICTIQSGSIILITKQIKPKTLLSTRGLIGKLWLGSRLEAKSAGTRKVNEITFHLFRRQLNSWYSSFYTLVNEYRSLWAENWILIE